eukprot:CAMPEP_0171038510 /NCGR_PEP_ID=MMETSP0736-20130129/43219_1 /TAXON_ID=186038 /ORGANISM="Fragilariopsis kerguelensis, Strain L26-C5" /LENGTH=73 /DNA_ID=CAMNT_0011484847 /DNA_START=53 /DNA_END=277 /DNA_ORIENTATION=-
MAPGVITEPSPVAVTTSLLPSSSASLSFLTNNVSRFLRLSRCVIVALDDDIVVVSVPDEVILLDFIAVFWKRR